MAEVGISTLFKSAWYKFCLLLAKYVTLHRLPTLQFPHPWTGTRIGMCISYGVSWKLWVWKEADYVEAAGAGQESFTVFIVICLPTSRMALGLRNEALCFLGPLGNRIHGVTWVGTCRSLSIVPRRLKWEAVSSPFLLLITINRTEC